MLYSGSWQFLLLDISLVRQNRGHSHDNGANKRGAMLYRAQGYSTFLYQIKIEMIFLLFLLDESGVIISIEMSLKNIRVINF